MMKSDLEQLSVSAYHQNYKSLPSQISQEDAVELLDDLLRYMPKAWALTLHILIRKYGAMLLIRWKNMDTMAEKEFGKAIEKKADELLYRKLPDADPLLHATLKEYFLNLFWKL